MTCNDNDSNTGCRCIDYITIDSNGNLIVIYTDKTCQIVGNVECKTGATGPTGPTGAFIISTFVNSSGYMYVTLSNGTILQAGYVFGPTGVS